MDLINESTDALGSKPGDKPPAPVESMVQQVAAAQYESIAFDDFEKVDLRAAKITAVEDVPNAKKPLWKLTVDLGSLGTRTIVAGIRAFYSSEDLIGRYIIVVANLKPRSLAGIMSEGMLLAAEDDSGNVSLIAPDKDVQPGCRIR